MNSGGLRPKKYIKKSKGPYASDKNQMEFNAS
jgi:hypothetical protein